jgi:hypothetical protein
MCTAVELEIHLAGIPQYYDLRTSSIYGAAPGRKKMSDSQLTRPRDRKMLCNPGTWRYNQSGLAQIDAFPGKSCLIGGTLLQG